MTIDALIGNETEFPILSRWQFFNHAGVSPIPRRSAMALVKYAGQASENAYLDTTWFKQIEEFRRTIATLIAADRSEIAFVKNTSEGLSFVANGIDWNKGDRIVTTAIEYPANAYPWIDLQQRKGIDLVRVEEVVDAGGVRRVPLEKLIEAASHPRTRLLTLSHVEYGTGQRHDLRTLGQFCRDRGILFCVDGIQSIGVLPVNVREMNIDYLAADGHKWMLGPEGAGIFFCRNELIEKTHPSQIGWLNVRRPMDYDHIDYTLKSDAGRFESGTYIVPGLLGLKASIDLIASVGIEAISGQVRALTDRLAQFLEDGGYAVVSPRAAGEDSGIISFTRPDMDHAAVLKKLKEEHRIELAFRAGRLRCSPHFYNTIEQMEHLADILRQMA